MTFCEKTQAFCPGDHDVRSYFLLRTSSCRYCPDKDKERPVNEASDANPDYQTSNHSRVTILSHAFEITLALTLHSRNSFGVKITLQFLQLRGT